MSSKKKRPMKQGSILNFAQKQTAKSLFKSKDGMKQDKLSSYWKPKQKRKMDQDTWENSKRLKASIDQKNSTLQNENVVENLDLITDNDVSISQFSSNVENDDILDKENLPTMHQVENKFSDQEDFLEEDFNNSFFSTSWDNTSPFKAISKTKELFKKVPCVVPTKSKDHCLTKQRHKVIEVTSSVAENGFEMKIARIENIATGAMRNCHLSAGWANLDLSPEDIVNLVTTQDDGSENILLDGKNNLLIVHPDLLLSGTTISNGIACKRRAVLSEFFKNTEVSETNNKPVMLIGTVLHTIFQTSLVRRKIFSKNEIKDLAEDILVQPTIIKDMLSCGTNKTAVLEGVLELSPNISKWIGEYVRDRPTAGVGKLTLKFPPEFKTDFGNKKSVDSHAALTEVLDIEENVYSPLYGMKGKIDATCEFRVKIHDRNEPLQTVFPLELKTGRETHSMEHHAQVAIYGMFCQQRRSTGDPHASIPAGLLLYLKTGNVTCIPLKHADKREIVQLRNQIAMDVLQRVESLKISENESQYRTSEFSDTVDNERTCKYCSQQRNCALVFRSVDIKCDENKKPVSSLKEIFRESTEHLKEEDFVYFEHWLTCGFLELRKSVTKDFAQYLWLRAPRERQENDSCITNLKLGGDSKQLSDNSYIQAFKITENSITHKFVQGDLVIVSGAEPAFVNITSGFVVECTQNFISIQSERNFSKYPHDMTYSIDVHEYASQGSFSTWMSNLSVLMNNLPVSNNLRNSIIQHSEPEFGTKLSDVIPRENKDKIARMLSGLNRTQRQAIKRVLLSKDYTLVVGMPGSGKTTTIVAMVRILTLCGYRVLITSYTHSAVDNLLLKLIKYKVNFLRLGNKSQIHPSVHPYCEEEATKHVKTTEDLKRIYQQMNIVGCTCHSVSKHALFNMPGRTRLFDCCIVDEASQIAQPVCLGPLLHANRFVLVGDHRQLPPLIRSKKARSMQADESLFWRLTKHKDALVELNMQYRMNKAIMDLSNFVTYEGSLECATESVGAAILKLSNYVTSCTDAEITTQFYKAVDPMQPVVYINTAEIGAVERKVEGGICNDMEADIVANLVQILIKFGCLASDIGIITPFRKQILVIESAVKTKISDGDMSALEVNTVDKYQGRDKKVILMSFVRSTDEITSDEKGELLSDWRRLNVALTRAKHKLILIGNKTSLEKYETCKKLFKGLYDEKLGKIITASPSI